MERQIPIMTRINVALEIPVSPKKNRKVRATAVVVRCQYQKETGFFDIALFFSEMPESSREILKKYVDSKIKKVSHD